MMPGIRNGLTVILDANLKDSVPTTAKSNGFKVLGLKIHFQLIRLIVRINLRLCVSRC
jgi:hypothetical protein